MASPVSGQAEDIRADENLVVGTSLQFAVSSPNTYIGAPTAQPSSTHVWDEHPDSRDDYRLSSHLVIVTLVSRDGLHDA